MTERYFAGFNHITTVDMSDNPDYVEITEAEYLWLLNGMMNGFQVWINNGVPSLRTQPPFGQNPDDYEYILETDFWKRKPPSNFNGINFVYDENNNIWVRAPIPEPPSDYNGFNYVYDEDLVTWVSTLPPFPEPPSDYDGTNYYFDVETWAWVPVNPPEPE